MTTRLAATLPIFIALLLLTPLVVSPGVFAHFSVSKAVYARTIIEVLSVVWVVLMLKSPRFRPYQSWVIVAFSGYVLASILAAIGGINTTQSIWSTFDRMTGVFDLVHWLLLGLILMSVVRTRRSWWLLLNGLLGTTLILSLIAATQAWGLSILPSVLAKCRVDATLGNPSYLAPILVMSVLVAAGLLSRSFVGAAGHHQQGKPLASTGNSPTDTLPCIFSNVPVWRVFWLAVITFGSLVLVYTGTRGALIGLVGGGMAIPIAAYIWGDRDVLKPVTLAAVGVMSIVGTLFLVDNTVGLPTATNCGTSTATARLTELAETGTNDSSLALRLSSTRSGFFGFLERPILGWGPENFGYAFDKHVEPEFSQHGSMIMDKAHNQVVEEFTTKGLLGGLAFLALWFVLVRSVIRCRRPVKEEVLAYTILGALTAYFIQNLFLFDTPSALLWWVVLVAWAAWQEKEYRSPAQQAQEDSSFLRQSYFTQGIVRLGAVAFSKKWVRNATPLVLVPLLGLSIYYLNWQPYSAAHSFGQASAPGIPHAERLALSRQSFATFPQMANQPRRLMLFGIFRNWQYLSDEEKQQSVQFFTTEGESSLRNDPYNAPMLITAILFIQTAAPSAEVLASAGPLIQRLEQIAPNRAETHQLKATQALLEGRFAEALEISSEFQEQAPGTEIFFAGIERAAAKGLDLRTD